MRDERDVLLERWNALLAGLRGRPDFPDDYLDDVDAEASQDELLGVSRLLGAHEQGLRLLTAHEERELWDLAAEWELPDGLVMNDWVRERSVHDRPIPRVRPKRPLAGGGHGAGRGKPGKREFPTAWSDDLTMRHTMDVARRPDGAVRLPTGDFRAHGSRDGVRLAVVVSPAGSVLTSYPVEGPGVVQNALDEWQVEPVQRLQALVEAMVGDDERRAVLDELIAVGEWPHAIASLQAVDGASSEDERRDLEELARLAGLAPTA